MSGWYQLKYPENVATPCLLVYPERIDHNIQEMIRIAGGAERLRPHVKTHKSPQIVGMQQRKGINKFKCATIAEAEMLAQCQALDVLLAYQLSGPHISRFLELKQKYPQTRFSSLVDNQDSVQQLADLAQGSNLTAQVYIDLDVGMHRTGIAAGPEAVALSQLIKVQSGIELRGWHVYDGHLRQSDVTERIHASDQAFSPVENLIQETGIKQVVAGGSPTFPVHARRNSVELSPGTSLLWDHGYGQKLPDLDFLPAAVVLTRIVSKPTGDMMCLDLGHKAIASEMPHPRVNLIGLDVVDFPTHSEEHLVVRTSDAPNYKVGDELYGIPMHICPTTALHQEMLVVQEGEVVDRWPVVARDRRIEI
ncbi:MAG: D-TA family PLP-dependent enzyme [Cyclobacteriaceae bacterium]|nr:D-TA family PLP-dependent enzyme [Cyclobacteriaceae bacterium]